MRVASRLGIPAAQQRQQVDRGRRHDKADDVDVRARPSRRGSRSAPAPPARRPPPRPWTSSRRARRGSGAGRACARRPSRGAGRSRASAASRSATARPVSPRATISMRNPATRPMAATGAAANAIIDARASRHRLHLERPRARGALQVLDQGLLEARRRARAHAEDQVARAAGSRASTGRCRRAACGRAPATPARRFRRLRGRPRRRRRRALPGCRAPSASARRSSPGWRSGARFWPIGSSSGKSSCAISALITTGR